MPLASNRIVPLIASSELGSEKCRMRPSVMVALPENTRLAQRAVDRRGQLGAAGAAHVAEEALQDAEVGVAGGLQRDPLVAAARPCPTTRSRVSSPTSCSSSIADLLLIERDADRRRVLQRVVEQPHVERVDRAVDEQVIDVGELARRRGSRRSRRRW